MTASFNSNPGEAEKKAYIRNMKARFFEKQARLRFIKRKIERATESHRIQVSEQLLRAEFHADSSLEELQAQLELLEKTGDESWPARRYNVDVAWDDLSQAIKKVVARFP